MIGLYDSSTGQRQPQNRISYDVYLAKIEVMPETAVTHHAVVTDTGDYGLTLRDSPNGNPIAVISEGSIVELSDRPPVELDGFVWQEINTLDGQNGWVVTEFLTYSTGYTFPEPVPPENIEIIISNHQPDIRLISATQKERHTGLVTFEVNFENFSSKVTIWDLYIAHPEWNSYELLVRNSLHFSPDTDGFRLTTTPEQIREATGTDFPVVVAEMSDGSSNQIVYLKTFTSCPMDLTRTDEFTCSP